MLFLIILCILLFLAVIVLTVKVLLLKRGYDELVSDLKDQSKGDTAVPVVLSTRDRHAREAAVILNRELQVLRKEKIKYEEGNRSVSDSVTALSHDLRTPLAAINAYLELLEDETDEEKRKMYLERIRNRAGVLTGLTEDLFKYQKAVDISIVEKGLEDKSASARKDDSKEKGTDLARCLEECLLSFYAAFKKAGIEPEVEYPEGNEAVISGIDRKNAERIFENIIGNAVKYSANNLNVSLFADGRIIFRNKAPDISPVAAGRLLDKYYTVNDATQSTGLGLHIAKVIIEEHGGEIKVSKQDEDLVIELLFPLKDQGSASLKPIPQTASI